MEKLVEILRHFIANLVLKLKKDENEIQNDGSDSYGTDNPGNNLTGTKP